MFSGSSTVKNYNVKSAWPGAISNGDRLRSLPRCAQVKIKVHKKTIFGMWG
jgi:hypothetical protein